MAKKKIWLTWLPEQPSDKDVGGLVATLQKYGLTTAGNQWDDRPEHFAWAKLTEVLRDSSNADVWFVVGRRADFGRQSTAYGLSIVTLILSEARNGVLPIFGMGLDGAPEADSLPQPLSAWEFLSMSDSGWAARLLAGISKFQGRPEPEYRLTVHAEMGMGQWFEVGPRNDPWPGVLFGIAGDAEITHHGIGKKGEVPARTVLEYPTEGIKAEAGGMAYTIWSVKNRVTPDDSYYLKVNGSPASVIFGGHAGDENGEVYVIRLS